MKQTSKINTIAQNEPYSPSVDSLAADSLFALSFLVNGALDEIEDLLTQEQDDERVVQAQADIFNVYVAFADYVAKRIAQARSTLVLDADDGDVVDNAD